MFFDSNIFNRRLKKNYFIKNQKKNSMTFHQITFYLLIKFNNVFTFFQLFFTESTEILHELGDLILSFQLPLVSN